MLNDVSENLTKVEIGITKDYEKEQSIFYAHNELAGIINNPNAEIDNVIEKIMNLASAKFKACKAGDNTALSTKIKESLALYPKSIIADGNVIEKVIKRIRIHPNKEIVVEFINGKEIERREREIG